MFVFQQLRVQGLMRSFQLFPVQFTVMVLDQVHHWKTPLLEEIFLLLQTPVPPLSCPQHTESTTFVKRHTDKVLMLGEQ